MGRSFESTAQLVRDRERRRELWCSLLHLSSIPLSSSSSASSLRDEQSKMTPDESSVLNPRRSSTAFSFVPNCISSFSPAFSQTPFGASRRRHVDFVPPCKFLRDLHESFASTAEKCIVFFHSLASENPFLNKLMSLSSELQSFHHQVNNCKFHATNCILTVSRNLDSCL